MFKKKISRETVAAMYKPDTRTTKKAMVKNAWIYIYFFFWCRNCYGAR